VPGDVKITGERRCQTKRLRSSVTHWHVGQFCPLSIPTVSSSKFFKDLKVRVRVTTDARKLFSKLMLNLQDSYFDGVVNSLEIVEQRILVLLIYVGDDIADEFIRPEVLGEDVHVVLPEDAVDF
jgi:hypothetical protein